MKSILLVITAVLSLTVSSQTPQIAVVKPNGTTQIYSTWSDAYNNAVDNDNIYLPGGTFEVTTPINKLLHIYGAGYNEDSSAATGITKLNPITITGGGSNGSIEGIYFNATNCSVASITFGSETNLNLTLNYTVSNCYLVSGIDCFRGAANLLIKNNFIGGYNCNNGGPRFSFGGILSNSLISNNVITGSFALSNDIANLEVNNNIFFFDQDFYYLILANYSTYKNNIKQARNTTTQVSNSNFYNNVNISQQGSGNIISNNLFESFTDIFINPGAGTDVFIYNVHNDYNVKNTSQCKNSGADGTDRGIYGGAFPWKDGSVPSNPHIYFKQIAPQTNSSGQLQIQIKVRTNN